MRIPANAKINWALNIVGLRSDGYHDMDMLMQSISLADELDIEQSAELTMNGGDDNLVMCAARALMAHAGDKFGAKIHLTKHIPSRAGLGGGSADAAAALVGLNELWGLNLELCELMKIGLTVGADVPFCLHGGAARARGLGEVLDRVDAPKGLPLVLIHPGGGLSTPQMFRAWDLEVAHSEPADIESCISALIHSDMARMREASRNMLYNAALAALPGIGNALIQLEQNGALFCAMSGSGSAVFGAFESEVSALKAQARIDGAIFAKTE